MPFMFPGPARSPVPSTGLSLEKGHGSDFRCRPSSEIAGSKANIQMSSENTAHRRPASQYLVHDLGAITWQSCSSVCTYHAIRSQSDRGPDTISRSRWHRPGPQSSCCSPGAVEQMKALITVSRMLSTNAFFDATLFAIPRVCTQNESCTYKRRSLWLDELQSRNRLCMLVRKRTGDLSRISTPA